MTVLTYGFTFPVPLGCIWRGKIISETLWNSIVRSGPCVTLAHPSGSAVLLKMLFIPATYKDPVTFRLSPLACPPEKTTRIRAYEFNYVNAFSFSLVSFQRASQLPHLSRKSPKSNAFEILISYLICPKTGFDGTVLWNEQKCMDDHNQRRRERQWRRMTK